MTKRTPKRHNQQQTPPPHPQLYPTLRDAEPESAESHSSSDRVDSDHPTQFAWTPTNRHDFSAARSTPLRSSSSRQGTPASQRHKDSSSVVTSHADPDGCSSRQASRLRDPADRRRSILKRTIESGARVPRPSVSFAKQKEVLTFRTEEDR